MLMAEIKIATDFSKTPGWRYIVSWPFSWELFYKEKLEPAFKALVEWEKLKIDFDWTYWYPPSFVSEAFWLLYKNYWWEDIWAKLELVSKTDESLIEIIYQRAKEHA